MTGWYSTSKAESDNSETKSVNRNILMALRGTWVNRHKKHKDYAYNLVASINLHGSFCE